MNRFEAETYFPNDNQIVIEIPNELLDMFENGEVFYNGNSFGDPYNLNDNDFADDCALFAYKSSLENNKMFHLDENNNYADENDDQVLYSSDYFYNSFEVDDISKTKRGLTRIVIGC